MLFTNGKPKSLTQLKQDMLQLLPSSTKEPPKKRQRVDYIANPSSLVGQRIRYKLLEDGVDVWYEGYIIAFDNELNTHEEFIQRIINITHTILWFLGSL